MRPAAPAAVLLFTVISDGVVDAAEVLPWDVANVPGAGWPGADAAASNTAWPAGEQPSRFIAWPSEVGEPGRCWKTSVLEDTSSGWTGQCSGLKTAPEQTARSCGEGCMADPSCSVWQFSRENTCLQGQGLQCDGSGSGGFLPLSRAQRIQHGDVRVLKDMTGWEVHNLRPLGGFSTSSAADQIKSCRNYCYSSVNCQYWLFGEGGCYVEDPRIKRVDQVFGNDAYYVAEYPLTLVGASKTSSFAASVIAGEFIQHVCPAASSATLASSPKHSVALDSPLLRAAESPSGSKWLWWIGGATLIVVLSGIAGYFLIARGGDSKDRGLGDWDDSEDESVGMTTKHGYGTRGGQRERGYEGILPQTHSMDLSSERSLLGGMQGSNNEVSMPSSLPTTPVHSFTYIPADHSRMPISPSSAASPPLSTARVAGPSYTNLTPCNSAVVTPNNASFQSSFALPPVAVPTRLVPGH